MHLLGETMLNMSVHLAACGRLPGRWASTGRRGGGLASGVVVQLLFPGTNLDHFIGSANTTH